MCRLEELVSVSAAAGSPLSIVFLYEDAATREWARAMHERIARIAGEQGICPTWWNLENLNDPAVLAGAVSTTMRADIIVVATRATEGLPFSFYVWANSWLPHRSQHSGVLVALVGASAEGERPCGRVSDYLRAVAREARLDLIVERRLAVDSRRGSANGPLRNGGTQNGQRGHGTRECVTSA
jgi:hypothetical protein